MRHLRPDYDGVQDLNQAGGEFGAVATTIAEDEPVWLLRANDLLMPGTQRYWANQLRLQGGDPRLVNAAETYATLVQSWQASRGTAHLPDVPNDAMFDLIDKRLKVIRREIFLPTEPTT